MKLVVLLLVASFACAASRTFTKEEKNLLKESVLSILKRGERGRGRGRPAPSPRPQGSNGERPSPRPRPEGTNGERPSPRPQGERPSPRPQGEKPSPSPGPAKRRLGEGFKAEVLDRLDNLGAGLHGLAVAPFFGRIIDTFDQLDRICAHVMEWAQHSHDDQDNGEGGNGPSPRPSTTPYPDNQDWDDWEEPSPSTPAPSTTTIPHNKTDEDVNDWNDWEDWEAPSPSPAATEENDEQVKRELIKELLRRLNDGARKKRSSRQKRTAWWGVDWNLVGYVCHSFEEFKYHLEWNYTE